jgi:hypothetical protein
MDSRKRLRRLRRSSSCGGCSNLRLLFSDIPRTGGVVEFDDGAGRDEVSLGNVSEVGAGVLPVPY